MLLKRMNVFYVLAELNHCLFLTQDQQKLKLQNNSNSNFCLLEEVCILLASIEVKTSSLLCTGLAVEK